MTPPIDDDEEREPKFRVDLDGRVLPANEAALARKAELDEADREEAPPWSWLVAAPAGGSWRRCL